MVLEKDLLLNMTTNIIVLKRKMYNIRVKEHKLLSRANVLFAAK